MLRAVDKFDRLGLQGVEELLGEGRKDDSGDFTPGAKLTAKQTGKILELLSGQSRRLALVQRVWKSAAG